MIRLDYGQTPDGPTAWVLMDSESDLTSFRQLVAQLSNGKLDTVDCQARQDLFTRRPGVSNLLLLSVPSGQSHHIGVTDGEEGSVISWLLSPEGWQGVLNMIDGLIPASHQYFDYPEATIVVSAMENLKLSIHQ